MEVDYIGLTSRGKQKIIKDGYDYVKEKAALEPQSTGGVSVKTNLAAKEG